VTGLTLLASRDALYFETGWEPLTNRNSLPVEIKISESIGSFMNKLKDKRENSPPPYFSCGIRRLNIIHTRLRHNCILNKDLFRCNIINSPLCTCGKIEDDYHYFFTCPKYKDARNILFNNIFQIHKLHIVNTHVLLWGDNCLNISENQHLFTVVQAYIKHSGRFD
jgi:hypothetical protein